MIHLHKNPSIPAQRVKSKKFIATAFRNFIKISDI